MLFICCLVRIGGRQRESLFFTLMNVFYVVWMLELSFIPYALLDISQHTPSFIIDIILHNSSSLVIYLYQLQHIHPFINPTNHPTQAPK